MRERTGIIQDKRRRTNRMRADVNRNMVRSMKWASGPPGLIPEDYKCGAAC